MLSYIYKNVLKNCVYISLNSRHLSILKQNSFSKSVRADITDRRYKSFVSIFRTYGFSETQVSSLFSKRPVLLNYDKDKKIKPKLEFFTKNGFSSSDLCRILAIDPEIIRRNMKDVIVPSYEYLKSILKDDASVVDAIRRCTWLLKQDVEKRLRPNVELLRSYGVPDSRIAGMLRLHGRSMMQVRFRMVVEEVREMGFKPAKSHFMTACQVKCELSKTTWERKWNCYKKWGWSDDEILTAFTRQPYILAASQDKVERVMELLVNKMRWEISKFSCCPTIFMHSLENRTVPRCLIIQFLLSKGLIKKDFCLNSVIGSTESLFVKYYVEKYCAECPELLELYASLRKNKVQTKVT
ncbi:transcription termination factor MTERF15, mitochondrial-like [Apium graveolens]|uniref:transcription termination factor MTERF15, mitochondrial-like n=1 Tax=Apium graveolens TaxID=4045 RepID=UPI003D7C0A1A